MSAAQDRAQSLFLNALEIASEDERAAYVDAECGDDRELRSEVEDLLRHAQRLGHFLEADESGSKPTIDEPLSERTGTQIGPYKLLQQIGEGGMGVVYMAEQTAPVERRVALKIIKPGMDTRQVIARFEAERQALAMMDHPNIAKVLDAGTTDTGRPYFVMELVKGVTVTAYCNERQLTLRQRLELLLPVCQAIQHAHQKGVIHRDIKPSNVLIALFDGRAVPKVIDFGVAKATGGRLTGKTLFTQFGQVVGTLEYMSPEQAQLNQLDVDTRSDVYSLGVLLYELLTGSTPFDKRSWQELGFDEIRRIIREDDPPRPSDRLSTLAVDMLSTVSEQRRSVPRQLSLALRGELDWIVMKALEKDRSRRYESASALAADVERYLADEPVHACPPSVWYRFRKYVRRKKVALAFAAVVTLFVVTLGSGAGWVVRDQAAREETARRERIALEDKADREREFRRRQLATRVEAALDEVVRHKQTNDWDAAGEANRRAQALVADADGFAALVARIEQHGQELAFVAGLQDVRFNRGISSAGRDGPAALDDEKYAELFRDFGIDLDRLSDQEAALRLRRHGDILPVLCITLDDWAAQRILSGNRPGADSCRRVAQLIDPDPWRRQLRQAALDGDTDTFYRMSASEEALEQSPATIWLVGYNLGHHKDLSAGIEVLCQGSYRYPNDFWLAYDAGQLLRRAERDEESVAFFAAARALRPDNYGANHDLNVALADSGYHERAIDNFKSLVRRHPTFWWPRRGLAEAYASQGDYEQALVHYHEALALKPGKDRRPEVLAEIGLKLILLDRPEEGVPWLRRAITAALNVGGNASTSTKMQPYFAALLRGCQAANSNASPFLRKITSEHPDSAIARAVFGQSLLFEGKKDAAIVELREAVRLEPELILAQNDLGNALWQTGRIDEAIEHLQQAKRIGQSSHIADRTDLALLYSNLGSFLCDVKHDYRGAEAEFRAAIALEPKEAIHHYRLGIALRHQGRLDEAIASYRRGIDHLGESTNDYFNLTAGSVPLDCHINLSLALQQTGDEEAALETLRQARAIEPKDHPAILNSLAWLLATVSQENLRNPAEAVKLARKAVEADAVNGPVWNTLGVALYRSGQWKDSVEALEESMRLSNGGSAADWFFLALSHWRLGEQEQARQWLQRAVEWMELNQPEDQELLRFRAEAEQLLTDEDQEKPVEMNTPPEES